MGTMLPMTDLDLARRVASRDEDAIRAMMRRHNQRLFRAARAILGNDAEAEDVVQDAYLKAIDAMDSFRGDAQLGTWLVRITANEALMRRRKTRRSAEVIALAGDLTPGDEPEHEAADDPSRSPEVQTLRAETRRMVEARIDSLPEAFRAVFVMRAVEELSVEETAAALGIPEATVRTRFFRARGLLREALARDLDVAIDQAFQFDGARCDRLVARVIEALRTLRQAAGSPDSGTCIPDSR